MSILEQLEKIGHALTPHELAKMLSVSKATISRETASGRLKCFRIGTSVRFDPKAVAEWLEAR